MSAMTRPSDITRDRIMKAAERRPALAAEIVAALVGRGIAVSELPSYFYVCQKTADV